MEQEYVVERDRLIYPMPKEVDHHETIRMQAELDMLIQRHQIRRLILDFEQTEFMDSSGIGIIIGRARTVHFYGGKVYAIHLSGRSKKIFQAAGLQNIIQILEEVNYEKSYADEL